MENNAILKTAAEAGRIILENGGETYRVEDTINRICTGFGVMEVNSFVTPTGIIISITDKDGNSVSLVKRVVSRSLNLEKISLVNDLSRTICKKSLPLTLVNDELMRIDALKGYKPIFTVIAAAIAAAFLTFQFGGNIKDSSVSIICGITIKTISLKFNRLKLNAFFITVLCSAAASFIALIFVHFHLAAHLDKIIIGSIMLLVPGLAITNAIRDSIAGDLVSGVSIAVDAFLTAIAVATGTGLAIKLWSLGFGSVII